MSIATDRRPASTSETGVDWLWRIALAPSGVGPVGGLEVRCAGVLFEAVRLAGELGLAADASDDQIVVVAYRRWGLGLLDRVRGTFGLLIRDIHAGRTFVVRDHMGFQPLFYTATAARIDVAPSAPSLAQIAGTSGRLNRAALADALCRRYPDPEETFFEGVRRLPAGSLLETDGTSWRVRRYWDPLAVDHSSAATPEEAFERFETLQRQAVRRTVSLGAPAVFLSGGLDSASLAVVAADLARDERGAMPIGLSMAFPGAACDERPVQVAVADRLGLPHTLLSFDEAVGAEPLAAQALRLNRHLSSPLHNFWRPAYAALARRGKALGANVVLTGEGGDEWTAAPSYAAADLMAQGRSLALIRFLAAWRRAEDSKGLLWHRGLRPLAGRVAATVVGDPWDRRRARRLCAGDPSWVAPDSRLRADLRARAGGALGPSRPARGFAAAERASSLSGAIPQIDREEWFVAGQLCGMAFAHPYHDADLVQFFTALPVDLSNAGGWLRGLARRQLAARLPGCGFERQRKVLASAFHRDTLARVRADLPAAAAAFPTLGALGIVDAGGVSRAIEHGEMSARSTWDLINVEHWARTQVEH